MNVEPIPKPRKPLRDKPFMQFMTTKRCLYCNERALEPHHDRTGYGDGKGHMNAKPDDYRVVRTCHFCHVALETMKGKRWETKVKKVGREDIYKDQINNLIEWARIQGWALDEIYEEILDAIIDWIAKERK